MQQVTPEERSLAAAMRWQDELTKRGCLPTPDRAQNPLLGLASMDAGKLALLQSADDKLLCAAAAAVVAGAQARAPGPVSMAAPAQQGAVPVSITAAAEPQGGVGPNENHAKPMHSSSIAQEAEVEGHHQLAAMCPDAGVALAFGRSGQKEADAAYDTAQLARLPSAKGHCLSSYPVSALGRPPSPMKHPSTPGDFLGGLPTSKLLSVKPVSMQGPRPATAASTTSPSTYAAQDTDATSAQTGSVHPVVLERSTQPALRSLSAIPSGGMHESAELQRATADQLTVAAVSGSPHSTDDNTWQHPNGAASPRHLYKPNLGVPAASAQHAIPERLLTSKQASALLSGIPPNMRDAKTRHRELLQPADLESGVFECPMQALFVHLTALRFCDAVSMCMCLPKDL